MASPAFAGPAAVRDLSASGICCTVDRPLPVLSQVHLVLLLPADGGTREVCCDGAVVRCARESANGTDGGSAAVQYETAIFFTRVEDEDRFALEEFISSLHAAHRVA